MSSINNLPAIITSDNFRSVARALTIVENDLNGADELLKKLTFNKSVPVIGITGPPGAGKSTLVNALISNLLLKGSKVAVLAVDPTSPFNFGSLLGDRIRMAPHFNHPDVFIRSLATRGSLGGLSAKAIEMTDVLRAAGFDYILVETVGVGQSEIEIAGLADITLLVLVPESGDEIQNIKSGLMEIADAFIVNKGDRADADLFVNNLKKIFGQKKHDSLPVFKTVASKGEGIDEVTAFILSKPDQKNERKEFLLSEKAYKLIQQKQMAGINKKKLQHAIAEASLLPGFNLYSFIAAYIA
ncbi:methylmalonyl Co-A mutase-associated GTPase MeaB [Mucilaginibacter sp.]|uniref:methylmalonyl Co-A mutase-associated GTPase MeaB n=1 Tax=Mucilaginibacter sp. TaxID=1882438 RepID=UPI003D0FB8C1